MHGLWILSPQSVHLLHVVRVRAIGERIVGRRWFRGCCCGECAETKLRRNVFSGGCLRAEENVGPSPQNASLSRQHFRADLGHSRAPDCPRVLESMRKNYTRDRERVVVVVKKVRAVRLLRRWHRRELIRNWETSVGRMKRPQPVMLPPLSRPAL